MEPLNNYNFKEYNFTLWFFRILLLIVVTITVLVFALQINETISVREGEIVSGNPQADYKAPYEAQILKINVREGQPVKTGDTLLVMQNPDLKEQYSKTKTEIEYLQKKIRSLEGLDGAVQKKKAAIDQTSAIAAQRYQLDINKLVNDMKSADQQYSYEKERLSSANEKIEGDSILYKKDMLSKFDYNTAREQNLTLKQNLNSMQSQRNRQLAEKNLVYNNFTKEQNSLQLSKVQLEENVLALIQAKNDFESQLIQAKETSLKLESELNKQYLIALTTGIVNYVFNTKQSSNLTSKGELLVSLAPKNDTYYAKVVIPEKDMPYVKAGLDTRFQLSAYQRYQTGGIKGKVSYVAERKENEKFYALVELLDVNKFQLKSGYTINGEIVVERLPLYKYFIKKLFKRFNQT